jgi:hypothetical protein
MSRQRSRRSDSLSQYRLGSLKDHEVSYTVNISTLTEVANPQDEGDSFFWSISPTMFEPAEEGVEHIRVEHLAT